MYLNQPVSLCSYYCFKHSSTSWHYKRSFYIHLTFVLGTTKEILFFKTILFLIFFWKFKHTYFKIILFEIPISEVLILIRVSVHCIMSFHFMAFYLVSWHVWWLIVSCLRFLEFIYKNSLILGIKVAWFFHSFVRTASVGPLYNLGLRFFRPLHVN